ncbi:hypothetical protein COU74_00290 [Candidatus Peregrinibacteria bacterium CG10_big_fil_rev_8_21_14_0_10_36_19]|nr:MAG: hypothetical protein COU74_00290 [Candidatus Peregrinibacteria bacterium CG10_big_fil_rev_8_21_14_0_10_36_19]
MFNLYDLKTNTKSFKNQKLEKVAYFLKEKLHLTANKITALSFVSGLFAFAYLFSNHFLFIVFIILSLVFDIFDGAVARLEHKGDEGWIIDRTSDRLVTLLILLKITVYSFSFIPAVLLIIFMVVTAFIFYQKIFNNRHFNIVYGDPFFHILLILTLTNIAVYYLLAQLLFNIWYLATKSKAH